MLLFLIFGQMTLWNCESFAQIVKSDSIKLMTFNLRNSAAKDMEDRWEIRKNLLKEYLLRVTPDILCTQEALLDQVNYIDSIADYEYVGVGRDNGSTEGEFCAIFYRAKTFKIISSGTFWLAPINTEPNKGWDAALPRICTWAHFKAKSGGEFYVFNTHFDHIGKLARINSARLIVAKMSLLDPQLPVICTGDFNDLPSAPGIHILKDFYTEANDKALQRESENVTSFNDFKIDYQKSGGKIDYIFVNKSVKVLRYLTDTTKINDRFISDHFPVLTTVIINPAFTPQED
ncbi:MAG TPA: endonuclease/exonuclease/phosphatase family protein [Saprospiraceae bacterium]|nr:endonuclease/exonuclease/phosphatase family protein [Saprospiraceae bacterium]HQW55334.1 endonuclease/exonuclease/phosphatase family protein [Saprospiraceae bacterium]